MLFTWLRKRVSENKPKKALRPWGLFEDRNRLRSLARRPSPRLEELEERTLLDSGTWTQLANTSPSSNGLGTMILLNNGTVMVQGYDSGA